MTDYDILLIDELDYSLENVFETEGTATRNTLGENGVLHLPLCAVAID